jgi:ABC-type polysaccharide/polyol phosphate transport system ATPase subunit
VFEVGDAGFRKRCQARYQSLKDGGHASILVSHDPRVIARFADRAILIEQGRIHQIGAPADVSSAYLRLLTNNASSPVNDAAASASDRQLVGA